MASLLQMMCEIWFTLPFRKAITITEIVDVSTTLGAQSAGKMSLAVSLKRCEISKDDIHRAIRNR